jgi:hypothetical protein
MVRKSTLACLSDWSDKELSELDELLKTRRTSRGDAARRCVDAQIFAMVCGHTPLSKQWRLLQSRPARRLEPRVMA